MIKNIKKPIIKIRHIGLVVENIKKSIKVWEGCFGFKIISFKTESGKSLDKLMSLKNVKVITCKLKDENSNVIELLQYKNPLSKKNSLRLLNPNSLGLTHIALTVKDIDITIKNLKKYKFKIFSESIYSEDKLVKYAYAKSNDGIYIEIVEDKK